MKKLLCFIFSFLLLLTLAGCSGEQASETDMTLDDIAAVIQNGQQELPELKRITSKDMDFTTWLSDYYLLEVEQVDGGVICYADGVEASEIAVLLMADEKDCKAAEEALNVYIQNRASVFEGYAPQQAAMVKSGIVSVKGRYIALLICPEPKAAEETFLSCFGKGIENSGNSAENEDSKINDAENTATMSSSETEEAAESVGTGDSYNAEAVLQAYRSGDDSSLSEINRSILEVAKEVIESEINGDMTDYEK